MKHRIRISLVATATIVILSPPADAFFLPSFHLPTSASRATHIVVVTEGDRIDGKVRVLESWLGDLVRGDKLELPALGRFAAPSARQLRDARNAPLRQRVNGRRILLFLTKTDAGWNGATRDTPSFGGISVSSVWFIAGQGYALAQVETSGPQVFWPRGTETSMRAEVLKILAERRKLARARGRTDEESTRALLELVRSETYEMSSSAVAELAARGESSVPHLRESLRDAALPSHAGFSLLDSLARFDSAVATSDAIALLDGELAFCAASTDGQSVVKIGSDRTHRTEYLCNWMQSRKRPEFAPVLQRVVVFWETHTGTHGYAGILRGAAGRALKACAPQE